MVRIFMDQKGTGQYLVQTTCLDTDSFLGDLSEALAATMNGDANENALAVLGILTNAMPIAYKLSGYKAENVVEQRTLVCGHAAPESSQLLATAGR